MRKNFMVAAAMVAAGLFMTAEIARAADVSFSGQIRHRGETDKTFTAGEEIDFNINTRVRLNTKVKVNDTTSAFVQLQSVRTAGTGNAANTTAASSFIASDKDASVGIHQAYFTLNNLLGTGFDMKAGRQEVVLDGHRLYGHTGWTEGAQTNDAIRFDSKQGGMDLSYIYINALDGSSYGNKDVQDHVFRLAQKGVAGGNLALYFVHRVDNCGGNISPSAAAACTTNHTDNDFSTVGFRQAGKMAGLSYRAEYYHQFGDAQGSTASNQNYTTDHAGGSAADRDAYMFGVRVGKSFGNVAMKPSVTLWYDYLSGNDDSDITGNTWAAFNTLNDTGHKFYGFMDQFLAYGNVNKGLGLEDIAVKVKLNPIPGWTMKADYHWFSVTSDLGAKSKLSAGNSTTNDDLGTELDVTLIKKLNANTKLVLGYSHFDSDELFDDINTADGEADWAYIMFDVKF